MSTLLKQKITTDHTLQTFPSDTISDYIKDTTKQHITSHVESVRVLLSIQPSRPAAPRGHTSASHFAARSRCRQPTICRRRKGRHDLESGQGYCDPGTGYREAKQRHFETAQHDFEAGDNHHTTANRSARSERCIARDFRGYTKFCVRLFMFDSANFIQ